MTDENIAEKKEEVQTTGENPNDIVAKAEAVADRLEAANKATAALLDRRDAAKVQETLGGKADVGIQKKEETDQEYAAKVMRGEL